MSAKKKETIASFEEGLEKLEAIVQEMEEGKLPLEKLITHYESGSKLLAECDLKLKEAEKKIEILRSKNAENPVFEDFDPDQ
ncbi:exodeoxyribonuclease VII small subunit [Pelagicoccus sp. SDUM812003]|uniref:exodeoxyribonuclease VII small subunit n=1 Tax=Pelagicoccus sp. SDUM812003 TaxID=3041267 RepID=UPI00280F99B3|nr:exodeoxyribonuclease VII small subunit [Pelagicoccus sp. SDUM812003]MDQ8203071.1 exodeoxyribonuclease VII small subunit [Pelagicoccus sp. SDUM812003]